MANDFESLGAHLRNQYVRPNHVQTDEHWTKAKLIT